MINEVNNLNCAWLITSAYNALKNGAKIIEVDADYPDTVTVFDIHSETHIEMIQYTCDNCEDHLESEPFYLKKETLRLIK